MFSECYVVASMRVSDLGNKTMEVRWAGFAKEENTIEPFSAVQHIAGFQTAANNAASGSNNAKRKWVHVSAGGVGRAGPKGAEEKMVCSPLNSDSALGRSACDNTGRPTTKRRKLDRDGSLPSPRAARPFQATDRECVPNAVALALGPKLLFSEEQIAFRVLRHHIGVDTRTGRSRFEKVPSALQETPFPAATVQAAEVPVSQHSSFWRDAHQGDRFVVMVQGGHCVAVLVGPTDPSCWRPTQSGPSLCR